MLKPFHFFSATVRDEGLTWFFEHFTTIKLSWFSSMMQFFGWSLKTLSPYQPFGVSEEGVDVFSDAALCVMVFSHLLDGGEEKLLSFVISGEIHLGQLQTGQYLIN